MRNLSPWGMVSPWEGTATSSAIPALSVLKSAGRERVAHEVGPDLVAPGVHVQTVVEEQLGPRLAIGAEHRSGGVDVGEPCVAVDESVDESFDECVRLLHLGPKRPAGEARLHGQIDDLGVGELGVDQLDKLPKVARHLIGRLAVGNVVVAGVEYDRPGGVLEHDPRCEMVHVGSVRAAEAAVDHRELGEALSRLPQADARATDEEDRVFRRGILPVPGFEGRDVGSETRGIGVGFARRRFCRRDS